MNEDLQEAERQYESAIGVAQQHQVVYEEFLCQLGLATTQAFRGAVSRAMEHLSRAQELISDRSDQLAYRFREVLVFHAAGIYCSEHSIRELSDAASAFGDMGLLQEQGFVRFHIARLKQAAGDPSIMEEFAALDALGKSLQNPSFLQREIGFAPEMKQHLRTTPETT
jgi:quinol monooxygenase YgiN